MTDHFYRAFEDIHRGSRELIKSRLRVYLPFVEPLKVVAAGARGIDLGCGRGEWLELMVEAGFDVRGVDLDENMLAACVERGLAAEHGDAIACLRALPDASVAVVSGFHIAEHIAFDALQQLVQEAFRVLKPAGLLILETPNPENLTVGASNFYLDPSHEKPIPPALLSFMPDYYGFARTKVLRLQESPGLVTATEIGISDVLSGASPDYAIVAQKGSDEPTDTAHFDALFARNFGVDLNTLSARYDAQVGTKITEILTRVDRSAQVEAQARGDLAARDSEIERLHAHISAKHSEIESLHERLATQNSEIERLHAQVATQDSEIERLHAHIATQDSEIERLHAQVATQDSEIERLHAQVAVQDSEIERLHAHISAKHSEIESLHERVATQNSEIDRLHAHVVWQQQAWDGATAELSRTQAQLAGTYASSSWRATAPLRALATWTRSLRSLPARTTLAIKIRLKPLIVAAGGYLSARATMKARLALILRPFPRLKARLARAASAQPASAFDVNPIELVDQPFDSSAQPALAPNDNPPLLASLWEPTPIVSVPEGLTERARRVFEDLLQQRTAVEAQSRMAQDSKGH